MTIDVLRERLVYWQRVLRLQDWDIEVRVLPQHHLNADSPMSTGRVSFNHVYRSACILVADPATVIDDHTAAFTRHSVYDPEQTLVHELVHLLMPSPGEVKVDVEFTVEAVSKALVRLDRRQDASADCRASTSELDGHLLANALGGVLDRRGVR
ncbi:hypothetical protein [Luteitalea sp.]|uniref:hypothetical protein n=1 Tax=Luteitalea sp. TaxID=2004800 RepID=UPI0025BEB17D|nr:hypothetical protein [Luteitalea sp.]